jgi:hypothetical protein
MFRSSRGSEWARISPAKVRVKRQRSVNLALSATNDGHAILREIDVAHPAAKSMIELSRTQDEEVGDGTTSVIILGTFLQSIVEGVAKCFDDDNRVDVSFKQGQ